MPKYNLESSMTDRANVHEWGNRDGYEVANQHYAVNNILTGNELQEYARLDASAIIEQNRGDEVPLVDNEQEFIGMYVEDYVKAYKEQIASRQQDQQEELLMSDERKTS